MGTKIRSFTDVINAFGGPTKYAASIGVETFHAQSMKNRDSIPPAYWNKTVGAAEDGAIEGVTLDVLAKLAEAKADQRAAS